MNKMIICILLSMCLIGNVYATGADHHDPKTCKVKSHKHPPAPKPKPKPTPKPAPAPKQNQDQQQGQQQGQAQLQGQHQSAISKANASASASSKANSSSTSTGGDASNSNNITVESIESNSFPRLAASAAPVVGADCTIAMSAQTADAGIAASFPDASCQAFAAANWHWMQYEHNLELARRYTEDALVLKEAWHGCQYKASNSCGPDTMEAIKVKAAQADKFYSVALAELDRKEAMEHKAVAILERSLPFGEFGGIVTRIFPFLGGYEIVTK